MIVKTFKFRRGQKPDAVLEMEKQKKYPEFLKKLWKDDELINGIFVELDCPFGRHVTVSLFDGEVIITMQHTGGHKLADPILTIMRVDDSVKVTVLGSDPHAEFRRKIADISVSACEAMNEMNLI